MFGLRAHRATELLLPPALHSVHFIFVEQADEVGDLLRGSHMILAERVLLEIDSSAEAQGFGRYDERGRVSRVQGGGGLLVGREGGEERVARHPLRRQRLSTSANSLRRCHILESLRCLPDLDWQLEFC